MSLNLFRRFICVFSFWSLLVIASSVQAQSPAGVFRGRWTSQSTGHSGPMRARVTPNSDGTYDARFTGRFAVVIPFTYKVTLTPVACDGCGTTLVANKKLGPLLGSYQISAIASGAGMNGSFSAAGDVGSVNMQRIR